MPAAGLAAELQFVNYGSVTAIIFFLEVIKQLTALSYEMQQTATAVMILLVDLEVLGQLLDASSQQGNLHFRRTGVGSAALVFFYDLLGVDYLFAFYW